MKNITTTGQNILMSNVEVMRRNVEYPGTEQSSTWTSSSLSRDQQTSSFFLHYYDLFRLNMTIQTEIKSLLQM